MIAHVFLPALERLQCLDTGATHSDRFVERTNPFEYDVIGERTSAQAPGSNR
jgi:hypothetical protein